MVLTLLPVSALAAEGTSGQPVNADFKIMGLYALRDNGRRVSYFSYETRETEFLTDANISYPESWFKLVHVIEKSQPVTLELYEINDDPAYLDTDRIFMPYLPTDTADGFGKLQGEEFLGERLGVLVGVPVQENIVPINEGDDIFTAPKVGYEPIEEDEWLNIIYDTISGERKPQLLQNFYSFGYEGNRLEILDAEKDVPVLDVPPTEEPPIEEPSVEEPPIEEPPVEEPSVETPPAANETAPEDESTGTAGSDIDEQSQTNTEPPISPESETETPSESQVEDTPDLVEEPSEKENGNDSGTSETQPVTELSKPQVLTNSVADADESQNKNDPPDETGIVTTPENPAAPGTDSTNEEQPQTETPSETTDPEAENNTEEPLLDETDPNAGTDSDIDSPNTDQETPPATEVVPPATEEPLEEPPVGSEVPEQEEIHYLPESAVFPPDQAQLFSTVEADDETIQNIVLWDGHYQTDDGEITRITEGGRYVIVMQPCTPETSIYNSFLGFDVPEQSEALDTFESINSWEDLMAIRDELACSGDPVDLLSGSFTWNYRDLALYGKNDLEFTRYYESVHADENYGLGNGWTSNFSYSLEFDGRSVLAHLPRGTLLYFPIDFDGSYGECGDYTLASQGSGYVMTDKSGTAYAFDGDGRILSIVYLDGNTLSFQYSGDQLQQVSNATGAFTFEYSGSNISKVTDSVGRSITLSYDGDLLSSVENPDGDSLLYEYDGGYLSTIQNFNGEIYVENEYDSAGRVIHQYAADFGTFDFTYDFDNRHNVCTGADGYINEIWFDEQGRITKRRDSSGEEEVTYNNLNQITSRTDREGNTTSYEYDEDGNISCTTYPDGTTEEFEYDENRMPTWIKDRNGNDSSYTYDAQGYVTSFTDGRGNTVRYDYDEDGNLVSYTMPWGMSRSIPMTERATGLLRRTPMATQPSILMMSRAD